ISVEPPRLVGDYVVLVPTSDADGNDRGCLLPPEVGVPLATYTGWNLRRRDIGAEGMLASLAGSYLPFPRTAEERKASGDPRRAVMERYKTFEEYETRLTSYCKKLVGQRYLTQEDADRAVKAAGRTHKPWKRSSR